MYSVCCFIWVQILRSYDCSGTILRLRFAVQIQKLKCKLKSLKQGLSENLNLQLFAKYIWNILGFTENLDLK